MNGFLSDLPDLGIKITKKHRTESVNPEPADVVVKYVRPKCPQCGSKNTPVYNSNNLPVRYHKCNDCGFCFKSVETEE